MKKYLFIIGVVVLLVLMFVFLIGDKGVQSSENTASTVATAQEDTELALMFEDEIEPGSFTKIEQAYEDGELSIDQKYAYELVAMFDSSQLAEVYQSENIYPLEGDRIVMAIEEDWDLLDPTTQELLSPLLLSFSDENSFFYYENNELREEIISSLAQF